MNKQTKIIQKTKELLLKVSTKFDRLVGDNWRKNQVDHRKTLKYTTTRCWLEIK